jgi:DNA invertase Pin-like site-specific DNA recombinase
MLQTTAMKKIIAYYRVSTRKQGAEGLGIDAQRADVARYAAGNGEIIAHYTEVESGKKDSRPELTKALQHAKQTGATLVIAKLDRISRNASFILRLRDSGVDFVACDLPGASTLTIGFMAIIAQHEREAISSRTKAAAEVRKQRTMERIAAGLVLPAGHPSVLEAYRKQCQDQARKQGLITKVLPAARQASIQAKVSAAAECAEWVRAAAFAKALRGRSMTYRAIADELNTNNYTTREGKAFHATTVQRLMNRA